MRVVCGGSGAVDEGVLVGDGNGEDVAEDEVGVGFVEEDEGFVLDGGEEGAGEG